MTTGEGVRLALVSLTCLSWRWRKVIFVIVAAVVVLLIAVVELFFTDKRR